MTSILYNVYLKGPFTFMKLLNKNTLILRMKYSFCPLLHDRFNAPNYFPIELNHYTEKNKCK